MLLYQTISQYLLHPDWADYKESDLATLPAFDRSQPAKFGDFMYHGRDRIPGQFYYDVPPPWWGTEEWTRGSNLIPNFHKSGLKNGYNIKCHIKIPATYWFRSGPNFQWLGLIDDLAEQSVFGDWDKTAFTSLHTILFHLRKKHYRLQELEREG